MRKVIYSLVFVLVIIITSILILIVGHSIKINGTMEETEFISVKNTTEAVYNQETIGTQEVFVWISKTGKRYHSTPECSNMKQPLQVSIYEAEIRSYTPCMKCY